METDRPAAILTRRKGIPESSVPSGSTNSLRRHLDLSPTRVVDKRSRWIAGHVDQFGDGAAFPTSR